MSIYNPAIFSIDPAETKRYAGLQKTEFNPKLIEEACTEAQLLIQPKGIWHIYEYEAASQLILPQEISLQGKSIGRHLKDSHKVAVLAATVGETIENQVTKSFEEGRYSFSVLLDAAATTAVEALADSMEKSIFSEVKRQGLSMTWRFSPGYGDWPIQQQPEILALAQGEKIGIQLTESLMLMPRKSITAVIGLYHAPALCCLPAEKKPHCHQCDKLDCPARRDN